MLMGFQCRYFISYDNVLTLIYHVHKALPVDFFHNKHASKNAITTFAIDANYKLINVDIRLKPKHYFRLCCLRYKIYVLLNSLHGVLTSGSRLLLGIYVYLLLPIVSRIYLPLFDCCALRRHAIQVIQRRCLTHSMPPLPCASLGM